MRSPDFWQMVKDIYHEKLFSTRTMVMLPILALFIPGMAWGFADPNIILPDGHQPTSAMEILFYASLGIVFGGTIFSVLLCYDTISKERSSGVLEIKLAQPVARSTLADATIIGSSLAVLTPILILQILSILVVWYRTGDLLGLGDSLTYLSATIMFLTTYTIFSLWVSSMTRDAGTSVAFGIGLWIFFTFLWALVTTMVAYASGVAIGEANDPEWIKLEAMLDLLSPNGVYHHLLETRIPSIQRGVHTGLKLVSAILWIVIPGYLFRRRMEVLSP